MPSRPSTEDFLPEIPSRIFLYRRNTSSKYPYEWITLAHVCHHWRELAQHTSALWTYIRVVESVSMDCVTQMLINSRRWALTAKVYIYDQPIDDLVKTVLGEMHRVENLLFFVCSDGSVEAAKNAFSLIMSRAQEIRLKSLFLWGQHNHWAPTWTQMRRLLSPSMQKLCLRFAELPAMEELRSALRGMPSLAELELHFSSLIDHSEADLESSPRQIIQLEQLGKIHLHGRPLTCAALLTSLAFPSTTSVTVHCPRPVEHTDSQHQLLIDALLQTFRSRSDTTIQLPLSSLYIKRSSEHDCVVVDAWTAAHAFQVLKDRPEGQRLHLVLSRSITTHFLKAFDGQLQNVENVFIHCDNADEWGEIVRKMSNLRELTVVGGTYDIITQALSSIPKDEGYIMNDAEILEHMKINPPLRYLQTLMTIQSFTPFTPSPQIKENLLELFLLLSILRARKLLCIGPDSITSTDRVAKNNLSGLGDALLTSALDACRLGSRLCEFDRDLISEPEGFEDRMEDAYAYHSDAESSEDEE